MTSALIAPLGRARFIVTLPPDPSMVGQKLVGLADASFMSHTDTKDAFLHLARRAKERLVILTPFIDATGAAWAAGLFEATGARQKLLVLREHSQLNSCGAVGSRLRAAAHSIFQYSFENLREDGQTYVETFHAKIVLADGNAAYVGSANFLYRSREVNLECGFLLEGEAVAPVSILVDAVLEAIKPPRL